jgi:hypothetical protein
MPFIGGTLLSNYSPFAIFMQRGFVASHETIEKGQSGKHA